MLPSGSTAWVASPRLSYAVRVTSLSAVVLMALPFGVTAFLSISNPAYLAKFTQSLTGWMMVAVAAVMMGVGALWLKKTVAIRF